MAPSGVTIKHAITEQDMLDVKTLFNTYHDALGVDISYQGFETELANLPGQYSRPTGALLLARSASGAPIGCVCLKQMRIPDRCEMKRLFVVDSARSTGLGKRLTQQIIDEARVLGYKTIMLDSLRTMSQAIGLYESLGFTETVAYYKTPLDTRFFEKYLT